MSSSTRRSTPDRRALLAVCLTALLTLSGCAPTTERVSSGRFSEARPLVVANRTIGDGEYTIGYSLWIYVVPHGADVTVECTVLDTSGRIAFFDGLALNAAPRRWVKLAAQTRVDLPEVTLGIRCWPLTESTIDVIVRDVRLDAEPF